MIILGARPARTRNRGARARLGPDAPGPTGRGESRGSVPQGGVFRTYAGEASAHPPGSCGRRLGTSLISSPTTRLVTEVRAVTAPGLTPSTYEDVPLIEVFAEGADENPVPGRYRPERSGPRSVRMPVADRVRVAFARVDLRARCRA